MAEETKKEFDFAGMLENAFLMGIGVLEMTREKTNEFADELIERGKMSKSEAKGVADKISEVAEKQQDAMRSTVARETDRAMKTAGVATKADLADLRAEIAELKSMLAGQASRVSDAKASSGGTAIGTAPVGETMDE